MLLVNLWILDVIMELFVVPGASERTVTKWAGHIIRCKEAIEFKLLSSVSVWWCSNLILRSGEWQGYILLYILCILCAMEVHFCYLLRKSKTFKPWKPCSKIHFLSRRCLPPVVLKQWEPLSGSQTTRTTAEIHCLASCHTMSSRLCCCLEVMVI